MKNLEGKEKQDYIDDLFSMRIDEQERNNDFDYLPDGTIDTCDDCGSLINSHGHCPRCDY